VVWQLFFTEFVFGDCAAIRHSPGIALKGRALLYRDKLRILVNCDLLCAPKAEVFEENDQNYFSLPAFVDQLCLCASRVGGREGTRDRA
jgi:hypothetical protein